MTQRIAFGLVLSLVAAAALGIAVYQATNDPYREWYYNATEAHCEAHDGETYIAMVWGGHGGTHCGLPNGSIIHYHDVPDHELEEYHPKPDDGESQ